MGSVVHARPPTKTAAPRYAVYWVPPADHALWHAGCAWLGRDPGRPDAHLAALAAAPCGDHRDSPRRYGFHATLKPPMPLADGRDAGELSDAIRRLAAAHAPFRMPVLAVATLDGFVALRPHDPVEAEAAHPLRRLADACVRELDVFRAPMANEELARRSARADLDDAAHRHLARWGYPWVLDTWRFHMTLTDALEDDPAGHALRARLVAEARAAFEDALARPLHADGIALFVEDAPGLPLRLERRFALGG